MSIEVYGGTYITTSGKPAKRRDDAPEGRMSMPKVATKRNGRWKRMVRKVNTCNTFTRFRYKRPTQSKEYVSDAGKKSL